MAGILSSLNRRVFSNIVRKYATQGAADPHAGGMKQWRMVSIFVAFPAIVLAGINAFTAEHPERPEFVPYEYMRIRNKRFPWGDGNKSLFHNPHVNALPDGYEDDGHH